MNTMKASVIIPTFGQRPEFLRDTIECVQIQSYPAELFEILVVDNNPASTTHDVVKRANLTGKHHVRHIRENNMGLHFARHAGANSAQGEILIYIDDDVLMDAGWLAFLVEPFNDPQVGAAGGKIQVQFEGDVPGWVSQFNLGLFGQLNYGDKKIELRSPQDIYGGNMAIRKTVLFDVGGFNPDGIGNKKSIWFRGDGECGLNSKIYKANYKIVYSPGAWIYHRISVERLTPKSFYWKYFLNGIQDSFIRVRRIHDQKYWAFNTFLYLIYSFGKFISKYLGSMMNRSKKHLARAVAWYWYGKGQHALRVLFNKKLRLYVIQDNYL